MSHSLQHSPHILSGQQQKTGEKRQFSVVICETHVGAPLRPAPTTEPARAPLRPDPTTEPARAPLRPAPTTETGRGGSQTRPQHGGSMRRHAPSYPHCRMMRLSARRPSHDLDVISKAPYPTEKPLAISERLQGPARRQPRGCSSYRVRGRAKMSPALSARFRSCNDQARLPGY